MRTMLDLPDQSMKRAKIAAAERGVTLRELSGSALARDLATSLLPGAKRRVQFPVFFSTHPGSLRLTNVDIARSEAAEDRRRHGEER
jgi:hypothetical protein